MEVARCHLSLTEMKTGWVVFFHDLSFLNVLVECVQRG